MLHYNRDCQMVRVKLFIVISRYFWLTKTDVLIRFTHVFLRFKNEDQGSKRQILHRQAKDLILRCLIKHARG